MWKNEDGRIKVLLQPSFILRVHPARMILEKVL
jgi:hypothetical protein